MSNNKSDINENQMDDSNSEIDTKKMVKMIKADFDDNTIVQKNH